VTYDPIRKLRLCKANLLADMIHGTRLTDMSDDLLRRLIDTQSALSELAELELKRRRRRRKEQP
jgi:hypothetical protein